MSRILSFILVSLLFAACSENANKIYPEEIFLSNTANGEVKIQDQSESGLATDNNRYLAKGQLINYLEPLLIDIKGRFSSSYNESINNKNPNFEFHAYVSNMSIPDGSFFKFENDVNSQSVNISFFNRNYREIKICSVPFGVSQIGEFHFKIQIQNEVGGSVFAIWNLYEDPRSDNFIRKNIFNMRTADCSSSFNEANSNLIFDLFGIANKWGLILNFTEIETVRRANPYAL